MTLVDKESIAGGFKFLTGILPHVKDALPPTGIPGALRH